MEINIEQVKQEIENIKKFATKEQKDRLNFRYFSPMIADKCIYGLMTGDCRSKESNLLISKCIDYKVEPRFMRCNLEHKNMTQLELYIQLEREYNKNIIEYIKGETNKLELI